jgi:hypothetical protein
VKKLPDYAAFDKNADRKFATFTPPPSHPVIEARKPLLVIDLCWCREGESNPHRAFAPADFKSAASANFAIPARDHFRLSVQELLAGAIYYLPPVPYNFVPTSNIAHATPLPHLIRQQGLF